MTATSARSAAADLDDIHVQLRDPADLMLVERLLRGVACDVDRTTIARVINRSRADLAGSPPGAIPELLERLVCQRLS